jgi:hypothetical protein
MCLIGIKTFEEFGFVLLIRVCGRSLPTGASFCWLAKAYSRPATILVDEFYACILEGAADS